MRASPSKNVFYTALVFYCIFFLCNDCIASGDDPNTITININKTTNTFFNRYDVNEGTTKVLIQNIPHDDGFFLIQVHSFAQKVTLTNGTSVNSVNGTNIGLVKILLPTDTTKTFPYYIQATQRGRVLIAVAVYSSDDPIPGGCSMTFNTDIAPYLNLSYTNALIEVNYQQAALIGHYCEENVVRLEMYRLYMNSNALTSGNYFDNIETALSVDNVRTNGENITEIGAGISTLRKYIAGFMGLGQIIVVVAVADDRSVAYVPAVTYSCNISHGSESCYDYDVELWGFLAAVVLIFGITMFLVGNLISLVTNICLILGIAAYVLDSLIYDSFDMSTLAMSMSLTGCILSFCIILGLITCAFAKIGDGDPICSNVVISILSSLYVASLIVTSGLLDSSTSTTYWTVFVGTTLLAFILALPISFVNSFFSNFIAVGLIMMTLSYFCGGTMHHIVGEIIRYMTVKNYDIAVRVHLFNCSMLLAGIIVALLRSIIGKTEEGRYTFILKIVHIHPRGRRNNYTPI